MRTGLARRGVSARRLTPAFLDYVGWATLGVELVAGNQWLLVLPKALQDVVRSTAQSLMTTRDWGRDALSPLHLALRSDARKPPIKLPTSEFSEAWRSLSHGILTGRLFPPIDSFVLGVMRGRELGDPPQPCTASAITILIRGLEGLYGRSIREVVTAGAPSDGFRHPNRWLESESNLRERLRAELA